LRIDVFTGHTHRSLELKDPEETLDLVECLSGLRTMNHSPTKEVDLPQKPFPEEVVAVGNDRVQDLDSPRRFPCRFSRTRGSLDGRPRTRICFRTSCRGRSRGRKRLSGPACDVSILRGDCRVTRRILVNRRLFHISLPISNFTCASPSSPSTFVLRLARSDVK
jgi:hypothetical protein